MVALGLFMSQGARGADTYKGSSQDLTFVSEAAKAGMMEVHMGQLGAQRGSSTEIKSFSQKMIDDHTKANNELMALAKRKGIALPPASASSMASPLSGKTGAAFDNAFAKQAVADHQKAVALFQQEAKSGADPDLKAWASSTLPTLQSHLDAAKALPSK